MSFFRYVVRRLAFTLFVLLGMTVITFGLTHIVPADPVVAYLGDHAPQADVAKMRAQLGLDRPLPVQYAIYLGELLRGDLGTSIRDNRPVLDDLADFLPATIELSTAAILVAVLIGIPTGIISALYRDGWQDQLARGFALLGVSLPVFYLGLLFLGVLYNDLGWFPGPGQLGSFAIPPPRVTGMMVLDAAIAGSWPTFLDALWHLALPAIVLGLYSAGLITRVTRSSMLEALGQEYVRTAHAKGLATRVVVVRHAFRNALIPTVTVASLAYGSLLSGAVLTETIFSWPGIGRYATDSVTNLDIPAIMGVTLVAALVYSTINLVVDIAYAYLDPRIRLGG